MKKLVAPALGALVVIVGVVTFVYVATVVQFGAWWQLGLSLAGIMLAVIAVLYLCVQWYYVLEDPRPIGRRRRHTPWHRQLFGHAGDRGRNRREQDDHEREQLKRPVSELPDTDDEWAPPTNEAPADEDELAKIKRWSEAIVVTSTTDPHPWWAEPFDRAQRELDEENEPNRGDDDDAAPPPDRRES